MDPVPLPAPFGGVNQTVPVIALQSPNCQYLLNFNLTQQGAILRNGDSKWKNIAFTINTINPDILAQFGNTHLFLIATNNVTTGIDIYDVESGSKVYSSVATLGDDFFISLYFNKHLFVFGQAYTPGFVYDGSSWTTIGYTGDGVTTFSPFGGNSLNGRAYMIQIGASGYWYTDINFISGACHYVDLSSFVEQQCTLLIIAKITISDNISAVTLQSFVFDTGEVLFYSGSYPDSTDWQLIGVAKIGAPINYQSGIQYQGDYLVFCDTGVVSLRDLFLKGSEDAANLTVNSNIQATWRALIQAARVVYGAIGPIAGGFHGNIRGVWDRKTDRIIISFPFYVDANGALQTGSFYFVFFNILQAWSFHQSAGTAPIHDIVNYKNMINMVAVGTTHCMIYQKEGATGFTDRNPEDTLDVDYNYDMIFAPVSQGRAFVQQCQGIDVIVDSDMHDVTNYQLIRDFGVDSSLPQLINTAVSGSLQKPFVDVGAEGSYLQPRIYGTTTTGKTVGYQLYGINFWIQQGTSPR